MFPVGTHWAYSNLGIDLAGYILQVRSGMPFTQYVQEKVLDPLGMISSKLDIDQVRATSDKAIGHSPMPFRPPVEFLIIPSGGVRTTASDMARYIQFHINEGALDGMRLLRQDLAETMYEPPNPAALDAEYALGIGSANWQGTRRFQHGGGGFGFSSNMIWFPELKLGAVVLSNAEDASLNVQIIEDVLSSIISADIPLYHSRASTLPSVQPAYGFIQNGPTFLTDSALSDLIASNALPVDEAGRQRHQTYTGTYVSTRWGIPLVRAQVNENEETLTVTALDQKILLSEVQPGLFFDPQGNVYDFSTTVNTSPNYSTFKINQQLMPFQLALYTICGIIFLFALYFWPVHPLLQRVRRKNSPMFGSVGGSSRNHWLTWIETLSGLAAFFSLFCMGFIVFIPNLVYVPWPHPYSDLPWWQHSFLRLPFLSLVLAIVIALLTVLRLRNYTERRAIHLPYFIVALALLTFNLAILL